MKEINNFTLDVINDYKLFYMLKKIKASDGPVSIYHKMTNEDEEIDSYDLFEMNNGYVLVAFKNSFDITLKRSLRAEGSGIVENINTSIFETFWNIYEIGVEPTERGTFTFMDSIPIINDKQSDWRCDNDKYGAWAFPTPDQGSMIIYDSLDDIEISEYIMSVHGVGYIMYNKRKTKYEKRDQFLTDAYTQLNTYSIAELFKVIQEWSDVSEEPFSNEEKVATSAKQFLEQIGFDRLYVSNQPDMQIFEFLKGNTSARLRPENVEPMSDDLKIFVKENSSYLSLSALLSLFPDAWDFQEVLEIEKANIPEEFEVVYSGMPDDMKTLVYGNYDQNAVYEIIKPINPVFAFRVKFLLSIFNKKKAIIDKVDEIRSGSF